EFMGKEGRRVAIGVGGRLGRITNLFRPGQNVSLRVLLDDVEKPIAWAALISFYFVAVLSIIGAVILRRRRALLFPLLVPIAVALVTVAVTYSNERFRAPADAVLTVLAAVGIGAFLRRRGTGQAGAPAATPGEEATSVA